jgi:hypothetical protein
LRYAFPCNFFEADLFEKKRMVTMVSPTARTNAPRGREINRYQIYTPEEFSSNIPPPVENEETAASMSGEPAITNEMKITRINGTLRF